MAYKKKEITKAQKREREKMSRKKNGNNDSGNQKSFQQKEIVVNPRNEMQARYIMALESKDLVFSTGPAGTGKSYIALAYAAKLLEEGKIEKIIVTRPLVESGESIGALPGEMEEKMEPFFRPARDILNEVMESSSYVDYLIKSRKIELNPVEFLRGSTFKKSMIIVDESQNLTKQQMKLLLSRIGGGCKVVCNGDVEQSDLGHRSIDGMTDAINKLSNIEEVEIIEFCDEDIVRSKLAKKIIMAYRD